MSFPSKLCSPFLSATASFIYRSVKSTFYRWIDNKTVTAAHPEHCLFHNVSATYNYNNWSVIENNLLSPNSRPSPTACHGSRQPPAAAATTAACLPPTATAKARWWLGCRNQRRWTNVQRVSAVFFPSPSVHKEPVAWSLTLTPMYPEMKTDDVLSTQNQMIFCTCGCEFYFQSSHDASPTWLNWAGYCRAWRFCKGHSLPPTLQKCRWKRRCRSTVKHRHRPLLHLGSIKSQQSPSLSCRQTGIGCAPWMPASSSNWSVSISLYFFISVFGWNSFFLTRHFPFVSIFCLRLVCGNVFCCHFTAMNVCVLTFALCVMRLSY